MNVQETILPQARRLWIPPQLSREARQRLRWMDFYAQHGHNARLTCRHFAISSATFYRWWQRYDPRRLQSLEDDRGTRRPRRVRQAQTPRELVARIRALREHYPRWGKAKLAVLLHREGWRVSVSTVGRTLTRLRAIGQLREPAVVRAQLLVDTVRSVPREKQETAWRVLDAWAQAIAETRPLRKASRPT